MKNSFYKGAGTEMNAETKILKRITLLSNVVTSSIDLSCTVYENKGVYDIILFKLVFMLTTIAQDSISQLNVNAFVSELQI